MLFLHTGMKPCHLPRLHWLSINLRYFQSKRISPCDTRTLHLLPTLHPRQVHIIQQMLSLCPWKRQRLVLRQLSRRAVRPSVHLINKSQTATLPRLTCTDASKNLFPFEPPRFTNCDRSIMSDGINFDHTLPNSGAFEGCLYHGQPSALNDDSELDSPNVVFFVSHS